MIKTSLQKPTFSVALLLTDLAKCYKIKYEQQQMKQVKITSLWQQTKQMFEFEFTAEEVWY
jgi:hypothetical protein